MLFPSIRACNRNNFCESSAMRAATQTRFCSLVFRRGRGFAAEGDDGNGSSRHYFYVLGMLTTSTQTAVFTGAFRHTGVMELMARKRRFITRGDAVPVIDTGGIRFDAARHRFD